MSTSSSLSSMAKLKRNFYKRNTGRKHVLKQTIRPTYKKSDNNKTDEPNVSMMDFAVLESEPSTEVNTDLPLDSESEKNMHTSDKSPPPNKPDSQPEKSQPQPQIEVEFDEPKIDQSAVSQNTDDSTQHEIEEISSIIEQAKKRLEELEEKKRQQELAESQQAEVEVVEEFNGVDSTDEEIELMKEQLEHTQSENRKLKHELELIKKDFENEKKSLEKTVKNLKSELHQTKPIQDNKFFDFSKELREAVSAIETLNDPNFKPESSQVVIRADELPAAESQSPSQPPEVTPADIKEPKKLRLELPIVNKTKTQEADKNQPDEPASKTGADPKSEQPDDTPQTNASKKDKKKSKKLLMAGVTVLFILAGGGLVSYQLTSTPKVNESLVEEYMQESVESKVLGIESQSKVPDGIVADKHSTASLDETKWAKYDDPIIGIRLDYPANVTERLHSSSSITFLRKDSYIFKLTYYTSDEELTDFWEKIKDKGVAYSSEEVLFKSKPALLLSLQEEIEYPGNRYLVKVNDKIFDIWFATPSEAYEADDIARVERMLKGVSFY